MSEKEFDEKLLISYNKIAKNKTGQTSLYFFEQLQKHLKSKGLL